MLFKVGFFYWGMKDWHWVRLARKKMPYFEAYFSRLDLDSDFPFDWERSPFGLNYIDAIGIFAVYFLF